MKCCPTCLRPLPPANIQVRGRRQALFDLVRSSPDGVTRSEILEYLYFDDPDSEPESRSIVSKMVWDINKRLKKQNLKSYIYCGRGASARYRFYDR